VLDTRVTRRDIVTPIFYIRNLCSSHASGNLWTLYLVLRKVFLFPAPLSLLLLLLLFRRREGLISFYLLYRDLYCYSKLVEYAGTDEPASRVLRAYGIPEDIVYTLGTAYLN
jgi:hypothetical protein